MQTFIKTENVHDYQTNFTISFPIYNVHKLFKSLMFFLQINVVYAYSRNVNFDVYIYIFLKKGTKMKNKNILNEFV
jgi:hypothetical protein